MSNYEFWDELGKIFNAVVAYQEKTIEFNKRFINPWVRLGNVFDKQDRNKEAVSAYEQAIELDPSNPQNWFELGNLHFKMKKYEEAIDAYNTAIELDPAFGWSYSNLALTLATQGKYVQAIPLSRKSIELLEQEKDKAVAWNRLGNLYRKLNEYDLAVEAFQRADDLDQENTGFRDNLDEGSGGPGTMATGDPEGADQAATLSVSPIELILASQETAMAAKDTETAILHAASDSQPTPVSAPSSDSVTTENAVEDAGLMDQAAVVDDAAKTPRISDEARDSLAHVEETMSVDVHGTVETLTDTLTLPDKSTETSEAAPETAPEDMDAEIPVSQDSDGLVGSGAIASDAKSSDPNEATFEDPSAAMDSPSEPGDYSVDEVITAPEEGANVADTAQQAAYEQFLNDSRLPVDLLGAEAVEEAAGSDDTAATQDPVTQTDASSELQIELDAKNAHVWNELGNVYFNTSAYDDAIVAYTKAIELDRWFAWPYSNLALAYVQKGRFVEAILLYQHSIELFTSDKDKAISWNRLGNVYRRLNDYENAISSYQKADELDPDNTALTLQSRFSLLGSYTMEQKPSYVS